MLFRSRITGDPYDAGHVDDAAVLLLQQLAQGGFSDIEYGIQVDTHHVVELLFRHTHEQPVFGDTGVVDDDIHRSEIRDQVVERMAQLAPTPIEAVEKLVAILNKKTGVKQTRALNQTGGLKATAALLNALDKNVSKALLVSVQERNPELVQSIQQKMFTFADLANLETPALQRILREVDMRELAISLKSASDELKTLLLSSISKRAAETVKEEMGIMGPLKLRDIEAAQNKIIEIVRRLEAEGEIEINSGE